MTNTAGLGRASRSVVRVPPGHDDRVHAAAAAPDADLRPWAAYTLGREVNGLWLWSRVWQDGPRLAGAANGVEAGVAWARYAHGILVNEGAASARQFGAAFDDVLHEHRTAVEAHERHDEAVDTDKVRRACLTLELLAVRAVPPEARLNAWYNVGRALSWWERVSFDGENDDIGYAPFRPVVQAISRIPDVDASECDIVRTVAGLASVEDELDLRTALIDGLFAIASQGPPDAFEFWQATQQMHGRFDRYLLSRKFVADEFTSPDLAKPVWDVETRELRFRDVVVRTLRSGAADNVERLLTLFHDRGWPRVVPNPFGDDELQKLYETIRSLKDGMLETSYPKLGFRVSQGQAEWFVLLDQSLPATDSRSE